MPEETTRSPDILPAGYTLGGRYAITGLLGSGGMARVYSAHGLLNDEACKGTKKIYVTLKENGILKDESKRLINDLNLFADSIIELRA